MLAKLNGGVTDIQLSFMQIFIIMNKNARQNNIL